MSAWPGKYVIGLTGNIATGKSVVRRMLEHLGAYGIDADALGHRAIAQGAPAYQPVIDTFGKWILAPDGQIDRAKLGRVVFADAEALARLEKIIHPFVIQGVDLLARRAKQKVIVIEAIKLLESGLRSKCDTIWVSYAPEEIQLLRLMRKRNLSEVVARQRIAAQPPQEEKIGAADMVIRNDSTFEDTWHRVVEAWQKILPATGFLPEKQIRAAAGAMVVERASPKQASDIAAFITRLSGESMRINREDIIAAFGEKAYLLLKLDGELVGLAGWQVENLVARTDDIYFEADIQRGEALRALIEEIERASRELQSEINLMFIPPAWAHEENVWRMMGYQECTVQTLRVRAWQEAATESKRAGSVMMFKQLRKDRVLRPV